MLQCETRIGRRRRCGRATQRWHGGTEADLSVPAAHGGRCRAAVDDRAIQDHHLDLIQRGVSAAALQSQTDDHGCGRRHDESDDPGGRWSHGVPYSIMRGALQEVPLEELKTMPVHQFKQVMNVECEKTEKRDAIHLTFQDGMREGPYDMVVGCDGVDSVVKQYINGDARSPSDNQRNSPAVYSGIRIRYAIQDVAKEDSDSSSGSGSRDDGTNKTAQDSVLQQHFGNGTHCLTDNCSNGIKRGTTRCCFIVFRNALPFSKPAVSKDDENVA